jgi:transcription factor SPN1
VDIWQKLCLSAERIAQAEEAEEAEQDELDAMFKPKKKGRQERNHGERRQIVESFLARMEVAAEADIRSHEAGFPAVEKLKLLTDMEQVLLLVAHAELASCFEDHVDLLSQELAQRDLHEDFLDAGILGVLKAWLEPMSDGTLPNLKIRSAVLRALINLNFLYEVRWHIEHSRMQLASVLRKCGLVCARLRLLHVLCRRGAMP